MDASVKIQCAIPGFAFLLFLLCASGCEVEPSGPIARFGSTPAIDGIFEDGEWDDAVVVQVSEYHQFRVKHDSTNLYFAFDQDGGNLWLYNETGLRILHASAQLGSAEYTKSDSLMLLLDRGFEWQLYGLQKKPVGEINKIMSDYLAENGWVASIGPLGNMAQAEWAVSLNWMGVTNAAQRFVETPGLYIFSARMRLSPEEKEALLELTPEERKDQYPPLTWPALPVPDDSVNRGLCPKSIKIDPTGWSKIWIDLEKTK